MEIQCKQINMSIMAFDEGRAVFKSTKLIDAE